MPVSELFIAVQNHVEAAFPDYIATADKDPKNAEKEIRVHLVKRSEISQQQALTPAVEVERRTYERKAQPRGSKQP